VYERSERRLRDSRSMRFLTSELAAATGGTVDGPDVAFDGASNDSRVITAGQLFVPLVAERDGHDFIATAVAAGSSAHLTSRGPSGLSTAVVVEDTLVALQDAGRMARARITGPVVGITGSVGKTSVKDMLAAVLGQELRTAASERSFNNEIGVPLTLLGAADGIEAAVVEMGARDVGHIAELCRIAFPTIGVVTRVAAVHTEVFGTVDDVARAKSELVHAIPPSGSVVLNADDPRVAAMAGGASAAVVTYGEHGQVRADDVRLDEHLRASYLLRSPWGEGEVALAARGHHQVQNSLAVAAVALVCGLELGQVVAGLAAAELSPWRMDLVRAPSGLVVLNDAYNANPTSVRAALAALAHLPARRRVAVLGVMAELGAGSVEAHRELAVEAADLGIEVLSVAAPAYGAQDVPGIDEALVRLAELGDGDAVLVKGSRVAGLERLAEALVRER